VMVILSNVPVLNLINCLHSSCYLNQ
jgi:hypothetical protein